MNKFLFIICLALAAFLYAGCSSSEQSGNEETDKSPIDSLEFEYRILTKVSKLAYPDTVFYDDYGYDMGGNTYDVITEEVTSIVIQYPVNAPSEGVLQKIQKDILSKCFYSQNGECDNISPEEYYELKSKGFTATVKENFNADSVLNVLNAGKCPYDYKSVHSVYNKNGLYTLEYFSEEHSIGCPHPYWSSHYYHYDLRLGDRLTFFDFFIDDAHKFFTKYIMTHEGVDCYGEEWIYDAGFDVKPSAKDADFYFDTNGVIFIFNTSDCISHEVHITIPWTVAAKYLKEDWSRLPTN